MNGDLINQFVDKESLNALKILLETEDVSKACEEAVHLADTLNLDGVGVKNITDTSTDGEVKLISSFHNNLVLLIQKTWVEKSDVDLKAQVLYHLEEFVKDLETKEYEKSYPLFFSIVDDVVYLMFGAQTKNKEFEEYALRIDPEFGIFWWYVKSLPRTSEWSADKMRIAVLLGMYFLANY